MADIKWIKIATDIFDDEKILLIEAMPDADAMIVIWFKLLTLAGKQNNSGVFLINDTIPYTDEMLATIFRRPLNTVRLALDTFYKFGMIDIIENTITIPKWEKHQNIDGMEKIREQTRLRVARHREKQKLIESNVTVTQCNATDIDIDKDIDRDKEKEIDSIATSTAPAARAAAVSKNDVNAVAEAWNALGLGQIQKILPDTERGRLLKKRIQDYGLDAVLRAIRNVGESSFLRGGGDKGWVCTFDWLIKPGNFAKVLEGNYTDGAAQANGKKFVSAAEYNSRAVGPVNTRDLEKAYGGKAWEN